MNLPRIYLTVEIQNAKLDLALTENLHKLNENAVIVIAEYKNEIGTGGKDPAIQGGLGYSYILYFMY